MHQWHRTVFCDDMITAQLAKSREEEKFIEKAAKAKCMYIILVVTEAHVGAKSPQVFKQEQKDL